MGISISNQLLGSTGLSVGLGLSRGNGLSFGGFAGGPALYLPFALTGTLDPRITFSRPSLATMYDSTGKLTYAPNNLSLNSQNFSGANWAASNFSRTTGQADPFGGTNATLGTFTSNGGSGLSQSGLALPSDKSHIVSIYARFGTWRWFEFTTVSGSATRSWVDMQNGVAGATVAHSNFTVASIGSGWFRISAKVQGAAEFYWTPRDGDGNAGAAAANNGATFFVYGFQAEAVTYETTPRTYNATTSAAYYGPRFDYNPATLVARGLLIEEARTNLLTYSEQFDNAAWTKTSGWLTVTANAGVAPDGTTTADKLIPRASADPYHNVTRVTTCTAAVHAQTYYVKADGYSRVGIREDGVVGQWATFLLSGSGSIIAQHASATASIVSIGSGWYRIFLTPSTASANMGTGLYVLDNSYTSGNPDAYTYAGDGTSGVLAWGAQFELGSFATSYIPTVASAVARSADSASMTGTNFSSWYNQTQGTFVYNAAQLATSGTTALVGYTYVDASNASATYHYFNNTAANAQLTSYSTGGAIQVDMGGTSPLLVQGVYRKSAFAYALNDFAVVSTSGSVNTDTSASLPTPTLFSIGSQRGVQGFLNGHIASLAYYNTRLPNATLQSLTLPVIADYYFLVTAGGDQLTDASDNPLYTQPLYL